MQLRMIDPLTLFHPLIQDWFREKIGTPTDIQRQAWPRIAENRHVLLTAPTGSGKTLTAFLWALDRFATGAWAVGATRILYVSPLKALNNDIRKNLLSPLEALRGRFAEAGVPFPEVRVLVRSGDTPATERRRMLKHPPEILITTPESLNLMLLSGAGRDSLRDLEVVILDEIHAVAGAKRGTHLITAVDRLVPLAGEFQRIALSATVRPLETVAAWAGGYILGETGYVPRRVECIASRVPKRYELRVRYPEGHSEGEQDIWTAMAREIKGCIAQARSTLIFTNSRRLSERMSRLLNEGEERPLAYAHHGSLSREIRNVVETRMKEGKLPAIVATNSLELGIDIGALDQVILVQTPFSISSALQKIGRAGHGVGETSRGLLFASHGKDLLDAATAVRCVLTGDLEETRIVEGPLDLLAQILVSMAASGDWTLDRLYAFLRTSHPYRNLPRAHFDLVMEMLAGRFQDSRIRELKPRLSVDAVDGRITPGKGAALLAGLSGGTIPDRGLYTLRHAESRAKVGELDEEFVWERREGDTFALGNQSWRIVRITANEVEATQAAREAQMAPFWRAEERDRGFHFSRRLGEFLEAADGRLDDPALAEELIRERGLEAPSAAALIGYLRRQKEATRAALPHRRHLLIEDAGEAVGDEAQGLEPHRQILLHAVWGGRLNRPWAYAMAAAYGERTGRALEILTGDDCLLVRLPAGEPAAGLLDLVHPDNLEALLRKRLERTGYFAAHFRENAARALLLPRSTARVRIPLWLNRLRSQTLLQAVSGFADFPVALETWRECLRDEFDLPALKAMLEEVHSGAIRVSETRTGEPSPFAGGLAWKQTNQYMYERDRPAEGPVPGREDLLREIAFSSPLRPRIPRAVIAGFEAKARRLAPGYAPQDAGELVEWAKERLLIPWDEWRALLPGCGAPPEGEARAAHFRHLGSRLLGVILPGAELGAVAAVETLPRVLAALGCEAGTGAGHARISVPFRLRIPEGAAAGLDAASAEAPEDPRTLETASREALDHLARLSRARLERNAPSGREDGEEEDGKEAEGPALAPALSQWLRAYGPVTPEFPRRLFGSAFPAVEEALRELAEGDRVVLDALSEDAAGTEICDAANVEILLRLMRRRSRPAFKTLPAENLPLFLAAWQGPADPARNVEGMQAALEKLLGYPAPAAAWETDILPARAMPYLPSRLDELFRDSDLLWFGAGKEKTAFAFPEDLELFPPPAGEEAPPLSPDRRQVLEILRAAAPGRLDFQAIAARCPLPSDRIGAALWDLAWLGLISNDTFAALRKGVETGFKTALPPAAGESGGASPRRRFQRWKAVRPMAGSWQALNRAPDTRAGGAADALEQEELAKDRVRQALRRYGLLFRELLAHELPALQWPALFRSLRLLELSGEALSGHFFAGIPGLQFISPQALRLIESGLPGEAVYWMSAADPASPCALGLEGLPYALPPRLGSTHLVFHGSELALTSRRLGRDLAIRVPPRHQYLPGYLGALRQLVDRTFLPVKALEVETVNGEPVAGSPYMDDLLDAGFEKGIRTVTLRKRYYG
ncbi:MAG TPA: DEAD/DEAH box helicase [Fibrobacteria bacterium]|nr:DEAD/DEAH box helicase [Fibrobacteria bacterium]